MSSAAAPGLDAIAHLLPAELAGTVTGVQPISMGLSGAGVYALSSTRGELILRVNAEQPDASRFTQQLRVLRRAAERGVAPPIVHVDEAARAMVSVRVHGVQLGEALADPAQQGAVIGSIVAQLRMLHSLDAWGVEERDPVAYLREHHAVQRGRAGFPAWAAEIEPIVAAIADALARDLRRVVSHNDVNPGNILWDGTRAWLVDWEVAGLSHPFYDLATLAMFLQLPDEAAHALLAMQEQRAISDAERTTFAALRRLAALLCGVIMVGLVPDLAVLPAAPLTLTDFYAALRARTTNLQDPRGRGAFALALLAVGTG